MKEKNEVIELKKISKVYINNEKKKIMALDDINISFSTKKFYAIMGHSGSGKSTLINILGTVENITSGKYELYGNDVTKLNDDSLSKIRMKHIGFVFQDFKLNPTLNAYENVILPMLINKEINPRERKRIALDLLEQVGLKDRYNHFPKELSGGEQQRVAIARALANNPDIILADEPTGNLDEEMEKGIFELLKKMAKDGKCVIVVSHSNEVKKYADIVHQISKGKLVGEMK